MTYEVFILPRARRELDALPSEQCRSAELKIAALQQNPRPPGCQKLVGRQGWRIRFGNYRIIYKVDDAARKVIVVNVGHRREIYR